MKDNFIFSHGRKFNDGCPDNRRNTCNQRVFHSVRTGHAADHTRGNSRTKTGKTRNRGKALEESGNQCIFRLQIFLRFFSLRKHICHHPQTRRQIQTDTRCQQIRGGQCDKALNHASDHGSRDGGQNQQESKHTVVAAEHLPVLLSLLMLTGKVFL